MNPGSITAQFPSMQGMTYFNHAAVAPWPLAATEAVKRFAEENAGSGPAGYSEWIRRENRLRELLVQLLGARSTDDIALLKNTTECISTVAWGLDWQPGDNLVLPEGEFPSNELPWLAQAEKGVEIRRVDLRAVESAESALLEAMDKRTRLLAVSSVQWNDGFRLDLKTLGEACKARGVLFFVDAIQQLGALRIDVTDCHIDFLAADAHKWLLGPEGVAVFFTTAASRPRLQLHQLGWHMFDNPFQFKRRDWSPADSARRFEAGSPNTLGQVAFLASLELLLEAGMDAVEQNVLANTQALMDGLAGMKGVELVSVTAPLRRSGIVNFRSEKLAAHRLHSALMQQHIHCTVRGEGVRLSPHFYQGEAETSRVLEAISEQLT